MVTGGGGFFGSFVADRLRAEDAKEVFIPRSLATFGFRVTRPLAVALQRVARAGERTMAPLTRWLATRIFVVLAKPA